MSRNTVQPDPYPSPGLLSAWDSDEIHDAALELERYAPAASLGCSPLTTLAVTEQDAISGVVAILDALNPLHVRTFLERAEYAYHDAHPNRKDSPDG